MLFNSFEFLLFFPIVTLFYYLLSSKWRWAWLLAASCYFYMFFIPLYIFILFFTIIVDYYVGILLEKSPPHKKKAVLICSIIANLGILAVFKYFNFFADNVNTVFSFFQTGIKVPLLEIILPVGLSFHTFQALSYTIEVYKGNQKAERHIGIYALYVMFYPQLVAGPIERPQNILHQFHEKKAFVPQNISEGLKLILWGLFKKVVVADRLSFFVNPVYDNWTAYSGLSLLIASVFFAIQIYCDFSGYSDIALGTAKCMGIDLMVNFTRPYFAWNISEFWKRWHISLSTWFRDYVYIPLGGNRVSKPKWMANILVVFLLSGFWHGANWTFIVWGFLHGLYNTLYLFSIPRNKMSKNLFFRLFFSRNIIAILFNFFLVSLAWIFFRAETLEQGFGICAKILLNKSGAFFFKTDLYYFYLAIAIGLLFISDFIDEYYPKYNLLRHPKKMVRYSFIVLFIFLFLIIGVFDNSQFIYFQF